MSKLYIYQNIKRRNYSEISHEACKSGVKIEHKRKGGRRPLIYDHVLRTSNSIYSVKNEK